MNDLNQILCDLNLTPAQLAELSQTWMKNPLQAMDMIKQLNLSSEAIQKIMAIFLADPERFKELAENLGITNEMLDHLKNQLGGNMMENKNS